MNTDTNPAVKFELYNTITGDTYNNVVELSEYEAGKLNYAYAANGSPLRYFPKDMEFELELFKFEQPI